MFPTVFETSHTDDTGKYKKILCELIEHSTIYKKIQSYIKRPAQFPRWSITRLKWAAQLVVVRIFNATRHRGTYRQRRLLCTCICTALLSWITHAHLVPLSVTKRRPVHFILNQGHVEYELGVLMI